MLPSILLASVVLVGTLIGAITPEVPADLGTALKLATALQVFLSVGALPVRRGGVGSAWRDGFSLLTWHYLTATVPWLALWGVVRVAHGSVPPVLLGLMALAAMPPSAGLPAYSAAARVEPQRVTAFALWGYLLAPVATPLLLLATMGPVISAGDLVMTTLVTLVVPSLAGLSLGSVVRRSPAWLRSGVVLVAMGASTFVFGQSLQGSDSTTLSAAVVVAGIAAGLLRVVLGVVVAALLTRADRAGRATMIFATTFKNDALAATVALAAAGPAAMLPPLTSIVASMILVVLLAAGARRAPSTSDAATSPVLPYESPVPVPTVES